MKQSIIFLIAALLLPFCAFAQVPQAFTYQGQAVNPNTGQPLGSSIVGLQFSIQSSIGGSPTIFYTERHAAPTDPNGVFTVSIGQGTPQAGSGAFAAIDWTTPKFMNTKVDINNIGTFADIGTSSILSAPYALYAEKAGKTSLNTAGNLSFNANTNTLTATAPQLTVTGQNLAIAGGNSVTLPTPTIAAGTGISVSGSTITNSAPDRTVTLTGAGTVTTSGNYPNFTITGAAPSTTVGGDLTGTTTTATVAKIQGKGVSATAPINGQVLQYNAAAGQYAPATLPAQANITAGAGVSVTGTYPNLTVANTAPATTYTAGTGISVSGGVITNTAPSTNQTLALSGSTLSISSGNSVTLPTAPTYTGGTGISVSGSTITNTSTNTDNQTLSVSGNTLSISGGNSVSLPSGSSTMQAGLLTTAWGQNSWTITHNLGRIPKHIVLGIAGQGSFSNANIYDTNQDGTTDVFKLYQTKLLKTNVFKKYIYNCVKKRKKGLY